MGFQQDDTWQAQFLPAIKEIVGPRLLVPADLELDLHQATDLMILHARDKRIACRMRRSKVLEKEKWRFQFTIRCQRDRGGDTELQKILNGFGDWMFYGFESPERQGTICRWHIIDLDAFRTYIARYE